MNWMRSRSWKSPSSSCGRRLRRRSRPISPGRFRFSPDYCFSGPTCREIRSQPSGFPRNRWALAALFIWKSVWQAVFAARLYGYQELAAPRPLKLARLVAIQCTLQPLSLLAIPLSGLVMLPFAWTVAFFRNAGLFAALGEPEVIAMARRQAGLWTRQNWLLLSLISLAGLLLFINILIAIVLLPLIGRSLLGIENKFARLGLRLLNSTTLAVAGCVMWLVIDPLLDAAYVVRCFHGSRSPPARICG